MDQAYPPWMIVCCPDNFLLLFAFLECGDVLPLFRFWISSGPISVTGGVSPSLALVTRLPCPPAGASGHQLDWIGTREKSPDSLEFFTNFRGANDELKLNRRFFLFEVVIFSLFLPIKFFDGGAVGIPPPNS
jgi:hypothetical protein